MCVFNLDAHSSPPHLAKMPAETRVVTRSLCGRPSLVKSPAVHTEPASGHAVHPDIHETPFPSHELILTSIPTVRCEVLHEGVSVWQTALAPCIRAEVGHSSRARGSCQTLPMVVEVGTVI